eukprot:1144908-Pelagomonas_calceolata.AAC.3
MCHLHEVINLCKGRHCLKAGSKTVTLHEQAVEGKKTGKKSWLFCPFYVAAHCCTHRHMLSPHTFCDACALCLTDCRICVCSQMQVSHLLARRFKEQLPHSSSQHPNTEQQQPASNPYLHADQRHVPSQHPSTSQQPNPGQQQASSTRVRIQAPCLFGSIPILPDIGQSVNSRKCV